MGTDAWSWPFRALRTPPWVQQEPTWRDAKPALIEAALQRAKARPSGNWYLLAASDEVRTDRPFGRVVAGVEERHRPGHPDAVEGPRGQRVGPQRVPDRGVH
ncbi:MAG: hypothetical protein M3408_03760, partial [Actinomycetota bacterium]|nr:hypothetical protein [Actinomycetota bacterium]